ncbi:hypothetical protein SNUCP_31470 (plasmid) [Clostridium perfringens A]
MEKEIITQIATNGAFAALFIWLLYDTRKEAEKEKINLTI